jgi:hypothetical protein
MSKWIKKNFQQENNTDGLQYKEHREFFQKYFDLRLSFTATLAQCSLTPTIDTVKELYEYLYGIIEWTNTYIIDLEPVDKKLKEIERAIYNANKTKNKSEYKVIVSNMKEVFRMVNKDHEMNEIIPRLQVKEKDPWADEADSKKKVMLKTVMTMFQNV